MPVTEFKLEYSVCREGAPLFGAVIVAAGNSSRMGGLDKQMLCIKGIPVIARTMLQFQKCPEVQSIVVVTKPEKFEEIRRLAEEYGIAKLSAVVPGGASRQESVINGVKALESDLQYVMIHDGARPLIRVNTISAVAQAAVEFGAAACGIKVYDTLKRLDNCGNIVATVDRNSVIRIQTPQAFKLKRYLTAAEGCADLSSFTDDCALMEAAGYKIRFVEGQESNLKVTTPEDVALAENYLLSEEGL